MTIAINEAMVIAGCTAYKEYFERGITNPADLVRQIYFDMESARLISESRLEDKQFNHELRK